MLEAGRRVTEMRRVERIEAWRAMIAYANHQASQPDETRTFTQIVESDPRFMGYAKFALESTS